MVKDEDMVTKKRDVRVGGDGVCWVAMAVVVVWHRRPQTTAIVTSVVLKNLKNLDKILNIGLFITFFVL